LFGVVGWGGVFGEKEGIFSALEGGKGEIVHVREGKRYYLHEFFGQKSGVATKKKGGGASGSRRKKKTPR